MRCWVHSQGLKCVRGPLLCYVLYILWIDSAGMRDWAALSMHACNFSSASSAPSLQVSTKSTHAQYTKETGAKTAPACLLHISRNWAQCQIGSSVWADAHTCLAVIDRKGFVDKLAMGKRMQERGALPPRPCQMQQLSKIHACPALLNSCSLSRL